MGAGEASADEKTSKNSAKQCKTVQNGILTVLLAVIFEILNSKMLVLCSTHSQHIRNHISNNFSHLHNVSRGLETSTKSKIRKNQLMAVVNSATVFFGAKLAVTDENLNVYKLADSQNPFSALPI